MIFRIGRIKKRILVLRRKEVEAEAERMYKEYKEQC